MPLMEKNLKVLLAQLKEDDLAKPINRSGFCQSNKGAGSSFRDNLALPPLLANLERNLQGNRHGDFRSSQGKILLPAKGQNQEKRIN